MITPIALKYREEIYYLFDLVKVEKGIGGFALYQNYFSAHQRVDGPPLPHTTVYLKKMIVAIIFKVVELWEIQTVFIL